MKKYRHYLIIFAIIIYCIVPLCLFLCKNTVVYSSPEEFCQTEGYENYQIVSGESSVYIVYRESFSKVDYIMLKATRTGWVPIGYSIVSREPFSPFTATIYKGRGTDDNYIILSISGKYNEKVIKDARESTFYFTEQKAAIYLRSKKKNGLETGIPIKYNKKSQEHYFLVGWLEDSVIEGINCESFYQKYSAKLEAKKLLCN